MATHLVMGDPHCTPKASNDRFLWAGRLAADLKPNTIIYGRFCKYGFFIKLMIKVKNNLKVEDIKKI